MSLSLDEVRKVAKLARLELSDSDLAAMQQQLSAILDYVAQLNEIDTTGVEELAHPCRSSMSFDRTSRSRLCRSMLRSRTRPNRIGDYFGVPAVFDSERTG